MDFSKPLSVDIVLPVFNEEGCLKNNVNRLCEYLRSHAFYNWKIIIADNASSDKTPVIADKLALEICEVDTIRYETKGRGIALHSTFGESEADLAIYMDIDLSTSLHHINEVIRGLQNGSHIVVGSRLLPSSRIKRNIKREIISRCYNILVRILFGRICSDFQCGFKGFQCRIFQSLLPAVKDRRFFFDTETLILANYLGYRIREIPVHWVEDPDSRVNLVQTVIEDLLGLFRLRLGLFFGIPGLVRKM